MVYLDDEEYEMVMAAAHASDSFASTWARDTLLSRALRLRAQRFLIR